MKTFNFLILILVLMVHSKPLFAGCKDSLVDSVQPLFQVDYRKSLREVRFYNNLLEITSLYGVDPVTVLNVDSKFIYDGKDRDLVLFDLAQHYVVEMHPDVISIANLEYGRSFNLDWSGFIYNRVTKLGSNESIMFDPELFNLGSATRDEYAQLTKNKTAHLHIQYTLIGIGRADGVHLIDGKINRFVRTRDFEKLNSEIEGDSKVAKLLRNEVLPKVVRVEIESFKGAFAIIKELNFVDGKIQYLRRKVKVDPSLSSYLESIGATIKGAQVILYPEVVGVSRALYRGGDSTLKNDLIFNINSLE